MRRIPIIREIGCGSIPSEASNVLVVPKKEIRSLLRAIPRGERPAVSVVLPDMDAWVRDASDRGVVGAARVRARRAGAAGIARAARVALAFTRGIVRGDPAAALMVLLELERSALRGIPMQRLILAAGITDLAVATHDAALVDAYVRYARRVVRAEAWVETRNLGHLLGRLRAWGLPVDGVITPLNPRGLGMKPSVESCLDELGRTSVQVWARDVTAGGAVSEREGIAFATAIGASAMIVNGAGPAGTGRLHAAERAGDRS